MNKKILIAIILIVVLAVGAFLFVKSRNKGSNTNSSTDTSQKSIKELIASNVSQKCTYSSSDENGLSEGTTYISGGKMRGDFSTIVEGKTVKSHILNDGKYNYMWNDGEKTGIKVGSEESTATNSPDISTSTTDKSFEGVNMNQKVDYKCSVWLPDGSVFTTPSDIKFTDIAEMFKTVSAPVQGTGSSQCDVCNTLTGSDKTQCLSSLSCE